MDSSFDLGRTGQTGRSVVELNGTSRGSGVGVRGGCGAIGAAGASPVAGDSQGVGPRPG